MGGSDRAHPIVWLTILAIAASGLLCKHSHAAVPSYFATTLYPLTAPPGDQGAVPEPNGLKSAAGGMVGGYTRIPNALIHAAAWNSIGTPTDLNPAGSPESTVYGVDGIHQVGGMPNDGRGFTSNAWLWTGTAASAVNLHPAGAVQSWAYGVAGAQQVGGAGFTAPNSQVHMHAVLWQGSAGSVVDLNPPNYTFSAAFGTNGVRQVGEIQLATSTSNNRAAVWNGTANSVIDLAPASGYSQTEAYAVSGTQEVGGGYSDSFNTWTALLWNDSAASLVNLNPPGYSQTVARDTNGSTQVGFGYVPGNGNVQALLWHGTASSIQNLGTLLPPSLLTSRATSIDAAGNIFGVAQDASSNWYAVKWQPVPEPGALSFLALGGVVLVARKRPRSRTSQEKDEQRGHPDFPLIAA